MLIRVPKTKKSTGKLVWICVWEERRRRCVQQELAGAHAQADEGIISKGTECQVHRRRQINHEFFCSR